MAVDLVRIDADRKVHRFYRLDVQTDLFGQVFLIREWGRIGQGGTVRVATFANEAEAKVELVRTLDRKRRRGYRFVSAFGGT